METKIIQKEFQVRNLSYLIRHALKKDARDLSEVRLQIDGETENLDREKGEGFIDESGFQRIIHEDTERIHNLFLVAEVNGKIVGFSRCEGNMLTRTAHRVEFGVCVLKDYWGYGIGKSLLEESLRWADSNQVKKVTLNVLETNHKARNLYQRFGFVVEGVLHHDKILSDENYYDTILMARFHEGEERR